jgi:hypothetical protein
MPSSRLSRPRRGRALDIARQIADFEKQNGAMSPEQRQSIAEGLQRNADLTAYQGVQQRLDPVGAAQRSYQQDQGSLDKALSSGAIQDRGYYQQLSAMLAAQTQKSRDPVGAFVQQQTETVLPARLSAGVSGQGVKDAVAAQKELNQLQQQGVQITPQLTKAMQDYEASLSKLKDVQTTGFTGWANSVKPLKDSLDDIQKNFASGLSDAITDAAMGKRGASPSSPPRWRAR